MIQRASTSEGTPGSHCFHDRRLRLGQIIAADLIPFILNVLWRYFEAVEYDTFEWVVRFNNRRLLEPIGNISPAEAEEPYYDMLDDTPMAA